MTADAVPQQQRRRILHLPSCSRCSILKRARTDLNRPLLTDSGHPFIAARDREQATVGEPPVPRAHNRLKRNSRFVYVQFAEARPKLFYLMFGLLGVGSKTAPSSRKPYQQLSEALDNLVLSGRLTPQRRAGAESTLWALIHGLAVLRRAGALRDPFDLSWEHMRKFTADGLGINPNERTSKKAASRTDVPDAITAALFLYVTVFTTLTSECFQSIVRAKMTSDLTPKAAENQ